MFNLYVIIKSGYATADLMQNIDMCKQPLAYYSTKLDNNKAGLPPCYQGLAATVYIYFQLWK